MTPDPIALSAGINQNATLFRGEDKVISVDMAGYDLATATDLQWWMATSPYAIVALIEKDKADGIAVSGAKLDITISKNETDIIPEIYYHELRIVLADGTTKVAMTGNLVIRMSINPGVAP